MIVYKKTKLNTLVPEDNNPRTITKSARRALKASLKKFGSVQPIVVNEVTGKVVSGHQRLSVLTELGEEEDVVAFGSWTVDEEALLSVTLNNPNAQGKFTDGLKSFLSASMKTLSVGDFKELRLDSLVVKDRIVDENFNKEASHALVYKLVVTCENEHHQIEIMEEMEARGLSASPLIV